MTCAFGGAPGDTKLCVLTEVDDVQVVRRVCTTRALRGALLVRIHGHMTQVVRGQCTSTDTHKRDWHILVDAAVGWAQPSKDDVCEGEGSLPIVREKDHLMPAAATTFLEQYRACKFWCATDVYDGGHVNEWPAAAETPVASRLVCRELMARTGVTAFAGVHAVKAEMVAKGLMIPVKPFRWTG